jgi:Synaptobrevin
MTYYEDARLGNWFMKGLRGGIYIICTTPDYPKFIAVEALDEHFETSKGHVRNKWRPEKRKTNLKACCQGLATKWGTMEAGSAAYILMTEIDSETRIKYSEKVDALMQEVLRAKEIMHSNMQNQLSNMDHADALHQKSQEALEEAMVFKKKTQAVKGKMRGKNNQFIAIGTGGSAALGATLGLIVGGPIGAAILTPIFAVGFLGASGAMQDWGLSQKFVVLKDKASGNAGGGGGNSNGRAGGANISFGRSARSK